MRTVRIVPTGIGNIASVVAAFARLGVPTRLCADAAELAAAPFVVLPGVGAFGAGMRRLRELGLCDVLADRARSGRPLLAICLGMQLLCEASEEDPDVAGLGVVAVRLRRFPPAVRTPQLGWNRIEPECPGIFERGHAWFANSYRVERLPDGFEVATSEHGGPFVGAFARGGLLACQFHPEISGDYGSRLLGRWLQCREEVR